MFTWGTEPIASWNNKKWRTETCGMVAFVTFITKQNLLPKQCYNQIKTKT